MPRDEKDRARAKSFAARAGARPIRLAEIKPLVAASGGDQLEGHVTLAVPDPRTRRLVGHPAMAGAIGAALRASECRNRRIPRLSGRRPAIGRRFRGSPRARRSTSRRPGPRRTPMPASVRAGRRERAARFQKARRCARSRVVAAAPSLGRAARGARQWMLPVSLTPIRFALPITALRDGAPSTAAMLLALFPSSAICLRVSIAASVHISHALRCFSVSSTW